MRKAFLVMALFFSFVAAAGARAEDFPVEVTGVLTCANPHASGSTIGLWDVVVEIWESDAGDDDLVATLVTNYDGRFSWSGTISDLHGLGRPEIYLALEFRGSKITLGSQYGPNREVFTETKRVETLPFVGGRYQWIHDELIGDDESEVTRRSTFVYETLRYSLNEAGPPGFFGVIFNPTYLGPTQWDPAGVLMVNWNQWDDRGATVRALATGILTRLGDLSGAGPPPGGTFWNVTNEGYAWDEGAKVFLAEAMDLGSAGVSLESGVAPPANTADAPRIAATVGACLWDLMDWNAQPETGPGLGFDNFDLSLAAIVDLLEGFPVTSLQSFWNAWKTRFPLHYPLLALRLNGVDFNTPPVWTALDPIWANPGTQVVYPLLPYVSDAETPDALLAITAALGEHTDPVSWWISGGSIVATMSPADPPGHAFFWVYANDGISTVGSVTRIIWTNGGSKNDDPEITPESSTSVAGGEGAVTLSGPSPIRGTGSFRFNVPRASEVRLSVYDASGRLVDVLARGHHAAGHYESAWKPDAGVAPGVYFVSLEVGFVRKSLRTALIR